MTTVFVRNLKFAAALLLLAYTSCSDGKSTGPDVGPAAVMLPSAGENQVGAAGAALPTSPSVVVQDANGNPKPGVVVTFTPGNGGGSVTNGTATSNTAGIATVGSWILGPALGDQTLVASAGGVPSITFHALAGAAKCGVRTTHVIGSTSNGTLESNDCQLTDGSFIDFFSTTTPTTNTYLFRQSATFDTYLDLRSADGSVIAENDDEADGIRNSAIKILIPADTYVLGAGSNDALTLGNYQLSAEITSQNNSNCELYFVVRNVSTTQNIETTDCLLPGTPTPLYADVFFILLKAGQSITITMTSTTVDSFLDMLRFQSGLRVAQNDNKDATTKNAQVVFTAAVTDYYLIFARTATPSQTGSYTLSIQ